MHFRGLECGHRLSSALHLLFCVKYCFNVCTYGYARKTMASDNVEHMRVADNPYRYLSQRRNVGSTVHPKDSRIEMQVASASATMLQKSLEERMDGVWHQKSIGQRYSNQKIQKIGIALHRSKSGEIVDFNTSPKIIPLPTMVDVIPFASPFW